MRIWSFPNRVVSGPGTVSALASELARQGTERALVVTDRSSLDAGLVEHVGLFLRRGKVPYEVFAGVSTTARADEVGDAVAAFRDAEADGVVGVGAAGPIEATKLLRVLCRSDRPLEDWTTGSGAAAAPPPRPAKLPPMVAIPATSSAGAEVQARATWSIPQGDHAPAGLAFHPALRPETAILDPEIARYEDGAGLAEGAFDALTRAVEGFLVADGHPIAELVAVSAIGKLSACLSGDEGPVGGETGERAAALLLEAGVLAGLAEDAGTGACRSLARASWAEGRLPPGRTSGLCLPAVLDFNRSTVPTRLAEVARMLGARGDDVETLAFEAAGGVRALRRSAGLPEGLAATDLGEDRLPAIATLAAADLERHGRPPREVDEEDLLAMLRASE